MPRMFEPDEKVTLVLPAQLLNVLVEQLQKSVPVFPWVAYQPMMIEVMNQVQAANDRPPATTAPALPTTPEVAAQLERLRRHAPRNNSGEPQSPAAE